MNKPKVSVIMITYDHENYIEEAINGVLMQECDFDVEFIIVNDHSPDNTERIILEILKNHPNSSWIKYIMQKKNLGIRPNSIFALKKCQGKYIALCEGDDYWTDPLKLQKQVDFLENNIEVSLCFHNCEVLFDGLESKSTNNNRGLKVLTENRKYESIEVLEQWLIPTASVVFRTSSLSERFYNYISKYEKFMYWDIVLFLTVAEHGILYGFSDALSVYRRHAGGLTSVDASIDFDKKYAAHLEGIIRVFGKKYKKSVVAVLGKLYFSLALYSINNGNIRDSIISLIKTLVYDPKIMFIYLKNKI